MEAEMWKEEKIGIPGALHPPATPPQVPARFLPPPPPSHSSPTTTADDSTLSLCVLFHSTHHSSTSTHLPHPPIPKHHNILTYNNIIILIYNQILST